MKYVLVILVAVLISLIPFVNVNADQQIVMEIEGMTCKLWPLAIKKSLSATEGVENVKISYEQAKAWLTVSESIENKVLIDAVSRAGPFKGRVIERRSLQKNWIANKKYSPERKDFAMSEQLYDKFRRLSPKVTGGLIRMRSDTFKDSVVPAKYKILSALSIVVATKCEPCIIGYTKMAYEADATESELVEFLNVAITESGCPGEQWAMKSLHIFEELEGGKHIEADICCKEPN